MIGVVIRDVELLVLGMLIVALPFIIITAVMKAARKNETNPKGWFPDPDVPGQYRYFDGEQWTELHTTGEQAPPNNSGQAPPTT